MSDEGRSDNRQRYLARQIEQIRDTAETAVVDVVVKVKSDDPAEDPFLAEFAATMRRRGLCSSSRDLLPLSRETLERGDRTSKSRRTLLNEDRSLAARAAVVPNTAPDNLKAAAETAVQNFLSSEPIRMSLAAAEAQPARRRPPPQLPVAFWTSSSALVQVRTSDLPSLAENLEVEGIYLNQRLHTPPTVVPKTIPSRVDDLKVSAWGR